MPVSRTCTSLFITICLAVLVSGLVSRLLAEEKPTGGQVRVARWKDDRTAAFLLMFDDSWPSHWQVASPELVKRRMIATFFVCPGKGEHEKFAKQWDEVLWRQGMVYGDHTMTHKGVKDFANADWEVGACAATIRKITQSKPDRLVSYGQPGVGPNDWNITSEQLDELLKKHHLINRPPFVGHGAVYHLKTADEMLALADRAIATGGMEYLIIHGVERITPNWGYQDFWPLKQEVFFAVLDGLKERGERGKLWITDHVSMHQYETERDSAEVRVLTSDGRSIQLELKCKADPRFYDHPLTLVIKTPNDWQRAQVTQDGKAATFEVENGEIRFDSLPNALPIDVKGETKK